ncbi:hypothetical protein KJ359_000245 [Pestalotiopsis sp. 9143b]|nr:hypothetical protein KJ359_000245 [Pestalotiopsis sp. 9143b]
MPSYVITGVSKGLGFELLNQISSDSSNTVIGLVRDKSGTEEKVKAELGDRSNIHILQGDLDDYDSLVKAAAATSEITGGSLDYLIANGGYIAHWDAYDGIGTLGTNDPERVELELTKLNKTNVIGNIHLYNQFIPLILKGKVKKVVAISSGLADPDTVNSLELPTAPLYAISKAGLNMVTAKFNAQYKKDGILFLSICPGMVDVGHYKNTTPEQMPALQTLMGKFKAYAPHFQGPATPAVAMKDVISVWENATVEKDGGEFLSHHGNKQWL